MSRSIVKIRIPLNELNKEGKYILEEGMKDLTFMTLFLNYSATCCGMAEIGGIKIPFYGLTTRDKDRRMNTGFKRLMHLIKNGYEILSFDDYNKVLMSREKNKDREVTSTIYSMFKRGVWNLTWVLESSYRTKEFCEKYNLEEVYKFRNPNSDNIVHMMILDRKNVENYESEDFPELDQISNSYKKDTEKKKGKMRKVKIPNQSLPLELDW